MTSVLLAVDTPLTSLAGAEHALLGLGQQVTLPTDVFLCTHMVRDDSPHYAFSFSCTDEEAVDAVRAHFADWPSALSREGRPSASSGYTPGLHLATSQTLAVNGGRCVRFPGQGTVVGTRTVTEVLAHSAIQRLEVLGGQPAAASDLLHSRDFVRPLWRNGTLVLPVLPSGRGAVAPFEVPNPTPCCGEHALV